MKAKINLEKINKKTTILFLQIITKSFFIRILMS